MMLTCQEMKELEDQAFRAGATPEEVMEKVGRRMAGRVLEEFPRQGKVVCFLGKGHNAGDALVVARYLKIAGWQVEMRTAFVEEEWAELMRKKKEELEAVPEPSPLFRGPLLVLDGLVGIGAKGGLREPVLALAQEMMQLRESCQAIVVAMDLPSGLDGDSGAGGEVKADWTLTVGAPKRGLLADGAIDFVGRLEVIPVEEFSIPQGEEILITEDLVKSYLKPPPFSQHKGQAGRVAIIAGSPGMWGAAALCARGALRAGGGLVTVYVEEEGMSALWAQLPPEVMVRPRPEDWRGILADAVVVGPGLGQAHEDGERLFELLGESGCPVVLDADGLNLVAVGDRVDSLGRGVLLTPHPGEMNRLIPLGGSRRERAQTLAEQSGSTVLLKGARTVITEDDSPFFYNSTGSPGMATGGQGDTLSGVLGALLARGLSPLESAQVGAWLCGRAAEIALRTRESAESLTPSEVAQHLGAAFSSLRESRMD